MAAERVGAWVLACVLAGCFTDEPLPGGDEGGSPTSAATDTSDGGTLGMTSVVSVSTSDATAMDPDTTIGRASQTGADDDGVDDGVDDDPADSGTGACGTMGESCCDDGTCDEGVCLQGVCVAFAGVFLDGELCDTCPSVLRAQACGCPQGFEATGPYRILSPQCIKDSPDPWNAEALWICQAPTYVPGRSDFAGAYLEATDLPCSETRQCGVGNPYAGGDCACPSDADAQIVDLYSHCGDVEVPTDPPPYRLVVCRGNAAPIVTFGGVYHEEAPSCLTEQPDTASCDCPEELTPQVVRAISSAEPNMGSDLGFCVRAP